MSAPRPAGVADLAALNHVIEAAITTWDLPERVKRLTLPSYRYDEMDLQHLAVWVIEAQQEIVAVAAWEVANAIDAPKGQRALLLHGVYTLPEQQRRGLASQLFRCAEDAARDQGLDGIVVKAQKGSEPFYQSQGMTKLAVEDAQREFENRFYKRL